jgi:hypothetical protein
MKLAKSGMLAAALLVVPVGCAGLGGGTTSPPLCPHARYIHDMLPSWEYYQGLEEAFHLNGEGQCTLENCMAFERLNELERYCYQVNRARD